jgi:hypothetical protein
LIAHADSPLTCRLGHLTLMKLFDACLLGGLMALALPSQAAGGHHSVDDAAILDPGQCQVDTWYDRESGGSRRLLHVGPACRVGPVEVGLNVDRTRPGADTSGGAQVKWAKALNEQLSIGVLVAANWHDVASRYGSTSLVVPVSWQASQQLAVHVNAGRDFQPGKPDSSRAGASVEWAPDASWLAVVERYRENGVNYARLGGRWNVSPTLSVDLSRARSLGAVVPPWWTLGVTVVFKEN